eukprot:TRINITY_DN4148_c0_g1_i1.p1 TRINITY_DN4148_c0_g1~~TRINITY_DN4148_c0_g1_i1.p1  ORF type:complete len:342 (+),score=65.67 TRINITY_DN4148_c0_g1_i1:219-1244(+)
MEPKHFYVGGFNGRLGMGLSTDLVITDIPESSPCHAAGVPKGVVLTHVDGTRVATHDDVKNKLSYLQNATSIVVTVKPVSDDQTEWWNGVKGTIEPQAEADEEDCYDPNETSVRDVTQPVDGGEKALPAYKGLQFKRPVHTGYDSEPSEYNSDISDEEDQNYWQPPRKRFAHGYPHDPRPSAMPHSTRSAQPPHPSMGTDPSHSAYMAQAGNSEEQPQSAPTRDTPDGLHPCVSSGKRCNEYCTLRYFPSDACIHFVQKGDCSFRSGCRWLHCKQGLGQPGCAYQCETCGLSLCRKVDYQNHRKYGGYQKKKGFRVRALPDEAFSAFVVQFVNSGCWRSTL